MLRISTATRSDPEYSPQSEASAFSLPLNGSRRFRTDVVNDAIDAGYLIDDTARDSPQNVVGKWVPVRSHSIGARDGAQSEHVLIGPLVAEYADAADGQQHCECLPDLVVKAGLADLLEVQRVGLSQQIEL